MRQRTLQIITGPTVFSVMLMLKPRTLPWNVIPFGDNPFKQVIKENTEVVSVGPNPVSLVSL